MATLHFDADLSEWLRAFGNIEARIADASPAHEKIGDLLVEEAKANIDSEGGTSRWDELKPITLALRKKRHPTAGTKMLYVTGDLYKSLRKDVQRGQVDIGSSLADVKYARRQFYGMGNHPPKRSPFNWRSGVMTRVAELYIKHFFGALR